MLKHYIEFLLRNGTTLVQKLEERNVELAKIPNTAIAYRYFDRVEVDIEETIYKGKPKNYSEYVYM